MKYRIINFHNYQLAIGGLNPHHQHHLSTSSFQQYRLEGEGRTRYYPHHHHHHCLSYDLLFLFLRLQCAVQSFIPASSWCPQSDAAGAGGAGTECKTRRDKDMSKPASLPIKHDDDGKLSLNCVTTDHTAAISLHHTSPHLTSPHLT